MSQLLYSVGIDIGTSTTQFVISRLTLVNRANPFSVPRVSIDAREVVFRSGIHFTPLHSDTVIDAQGVRAIVEEEYRQSGFQKEQIGTGAVIITGETARKENARDVLNSLSGFAGDFVVATAGPDLESILAARGAGADEYSKEHHTKILHFDIGGGTSNLAQYQNGMLEATRCLDIGGRLIKLNGQGEVTYVSPSLSQWIPTGQPQVGSRVTPDSLAPIIQAMVEGLVRAVPPDITTCSFSGGVADCMWDPPEHWLTYGDIGPLLGPAVKQRFEAQGYTLVRGAETIRATVVGAGSHSTEVSGSTIFYRDITFPLKNLPILKLAPQEEAGSPDQLAQSIREKLHWYADEGGLTPTALGLRGIPNPSYAQVVALAHGIRTGLEPLLERGFPPVIVVEADMAKVLGHALAPLVSGPLLCLDGIGVENGDYVDIGAPVALGNVLPVIIKTLVFQERETRV